MESIFPARAGFGGDVTVMPHCLYLIVIAVSNESRAQIFCHRSRADPNSSLLFVIPDLISPP
jgi:hypothetical protein